ncbi:xylulose 5-phosphate/phosphate translocator [Hibiscus trionum]|uniref:Xylulose 5-phosphate/phosphate translocator n=1 Tax=Hibiscus trionum TaxID=183268 RepID=A0A9W7HVU6_HIBTR|nr:xylulose 5-phosphate/phosphate translocator [Hibiscus trionum]
MPSLSPNPLTIIIPSKGSKTKPPKIFLNKSTSFSPKACNFNKIHGYPLSKIPALTTKTAHFGNIIENPSRKLGSNVPKAAASSEPNPEGEAKSAEAAAAAKSKAKTSQLALVFGFWYFQNIVFNIYNKKALNVFPFPWLLASFQLFAGSVWMLVLWSFKLQPFSKITKPFIIALLGPALFHTIGHISGCVSFSKVAVSFTHVIKSSEPVFSVVFSSFLGDTYPLKVWLSIVPIVLGCSLAAITEVSFNFQGLWGALISNVGFVLRNIYSKRSLQNFKQVNGLNLYGWISIISLFYLFPVAVLVEGPQWVQGHHNAIQRVGKASTFYMWVMLSGESGSAFECTWIWDCHSWDFLVFSSNS